MKKLNKILATISTATLTFCVWGTQTQAKVVTNRNGVPTHIKAKTKEEFFGDLKLVLDYIGSHLVFEDDELRKIGQSLLPENKLKGKPEFKLLASQNLKYYNYALTEPKIDMSIGRGYLYHLLEKSTLNHEPIKDVNLLKLYFDRSYSLPISELVFKLPGEAPEYYTPNLRWFLWATWMKQSGLTPNPTTVQQSFRKTPEYEICKKIQMYIAGPDLSDSKTILAFEYSQNDIMQHAHTIIPKLISIAGRSILIDEIVEGFANHDNTIVDYDEFVKEYNKEHKPNNV